MMVETPDSADAEGLSGAAIEEEIGDLSSQLERQPQALADRYTFVLEPISQDV